MAASVWMKDWIACPLDAVAPMARAFALTIPAVTVEFRLNGYHRQHPLTTFSSSELPTGTVGKSSPSILISARSVGVSTDDAAFQLAVIVQFHGNFISTLNHVVCWLRYSRLGNNHARKPKPTRGWSVSGAAVRDPSPKKKSKISGMLCTV